jgi:hypothetical protein
MPNFAVINNGNIINIIVADDLNTANEVVANARIGQFAIEIPKAPNAPMIGWQWDGENFIDFQTEQEQGG